MSPPKTTTELQSNDIRLVATVIQSDEGAAQAAFGELFVTHHPPLLRFCASLVGSSESEDLAQTVWNKVWITLRSNNGKDYGEHFRSILFQTARRAAIDQWRSPSNRVSGTKVPEDFADPTSLKADVLLMQQETEQDRAQRLTRCMSKLQHDFQKRHAVAVLRIQGTSVPNICKALDINRGRADRLWHDAKRWLQECVSRGTA